jgi:hypothetical protein
MPFYFRKSANLGPIRLNFSKSGIGVSAGVRGARISTGPRGTFVHMGAGGVYYRQRIGGTARQGLGQSAERPVQRFDDQAPHAGSSAADPFAIPTADVADLVDATGADVLAQVNQSARATPFAWLVGITTVLMVLVTIGVSPVLAAGFAIAGGIFTWKTARNDHERRTVRLTYELEPEEQERFARILKALNSLSRAHGFWRIESSQPISDRKRNAGAANAVGRTRASIGSRRPRHIATDAEVRSIDVPGLQLFFLPDRILVWQAGQYGAVAYNAFSVQLRPTRFSEEEPVPHDAEIVDHTWRYVNRDGGPDRRFANNWQIPIVLYRQLELRSATGLHLIFHVSSSAAVDPFCELFGPAAHRTTRTNSGAGAGPSAAGSGRKEPPPPPPPSRPEESTAHRVLGVERGATLDEIRAAYRRLAQMYHPDKVAGLAPKFGALAEQKMREINAAYEALAREKAPS